MMGGSPLRAVAGVPGNFVSTLLQDSKEAINLEIHQPKIG